MDDGTQGSDDTIRDANTEQTTDLVDDLIRAEFAELSRMRLLRRDSTPQKTGNGGTEDQDKQACSDEP
jgi:hypothetical protein